MKLKFQKNTIELFNNSPKKFDVTIIFSFNHTLLTNARKHVSGVKISKYDDLSKSGRIAKLSDGTIFVVSLGEKEKFDQTNYLSALKSVMGVVTNNSLIHSISIVQEETLAKDLKFTNAQFTESTIFHLLDNLYYFDELKSKPKTLNLKQINFITQVESKLPLNNAISLIDGIFLVRDLGNNPANIVTPTYLADTAHSFKKISKKVTVNVLDEKDIKKLKMNAFLAVAQGSNEAMKFIQMEYQGAAKNKKPIVLVGKGITFDSGGISIKPGHNMDAMKFDMCGAATVVGIFNSVVKLNLPINLVCLVPTCENMPSGKAVKPGDVVTSMSGQTIEIVNTDAEGRLILCDALTYAKRYKPELVIDMATLTGACIIALGDVASGLYSNNDILANQLINSGTKTNDKVWRMPLFTEYHDMLKGTVADLSNIGSWKGSAGSVTAACFLEKFTDYKWAHLDIAGSATGGFNGLATGRPFYLLMDFLRNHKG